MRNELRQTSPWRARVKLYWIFAEQLFYIMAQVVFGIYWPLDAFQAMEKHHHHHNNMPGNKPEIVFTFATTVPLVPGWHSDNIMILTLCEFQCIWNNDWGLARLRDWICGSITVMLRLAICERFIMWPGEGQEKNKDHDDHYWAC